MKISGLFLLCVVLCTCDAADDPDNPVVVPSDLSVTIAETGVRTITVKATATNAKFYTINFGSLQSVKSFSGEVTHTYEQDGTYSVLVRAHADDETYISKAEDVIITTALAITIPEEGYTTPMSYEGMELVWNDEFDEAPSSSSWTFEIGTGNSGWGNNELQYYRAENTSVKDGCLVITAKKENVMGRNYTSSRMITRSKKSFQYGRVDIRAVLPKGQGIWPALWMLGDNIGAVGWPACGEIDIMEMIGGAGREKTIHGTIHWDSNGHASYGQSYSLPSGTFGDKFHVFSIVWTPTTITWYVDDEQYNVVDITPAGLSEFHAPHFLIFNVAVGGNWPGSPDASTSFPQHLIVDYVRVFQE